MSNFKLNLGTYGHNLLAYERDARGCKFAPGVNLHPGANLRPGANCAYEHGYTGMVDQEQCSVVQRLAKSRTVVVM